VHAIRTEYVVLTRSDELLEQVGFALDGAGEVRHAENEEDARHLADARHATVMLLDAREQVDPGLVVERLHAADGSTVIVVFAPADVMPDVAKAIKGSAAFAVLPVPIEVDKTRAVLQGAGEEALARRALISPISTAVAAARPTPAGAARARDGLPGHPLVDVQPVQLRQGAPPGPPAPVVQPAAVGGIPPASRPVRLALLVAAVLLVATTVAWLSLRDDASPAPPAQSTATGPRAAPSPATLPKDELLDRARVAFHERRYTEPDRDNALHYYRSVLAQDPQDAEAREGIDRIGAVLEARLESALTERRVEQAARAIELLRSIRPDDTALAASAAQLAEQRVSAALARGDADEAGELLRAAVTAGVAPEQLARLRDQLARLDASRRAAQLTRLVRARIRDGQLLSPPADSAKHFLGQLLGLPDGERLGAEVRAELARALAERAQRMEAQGKGDEAASLLAEARALGYVPARRSAGPPASPSIATSIQGAAAESQASVARPPVQVDVAAIPVATIAAPAEPEVSAADFRRTRYVAPTYPAQALARGLSGDVRVRIRVDTSGRVAEVQVLSANPPGVFEQAAVTAVRKWRFEPVMANGRAIEAGVTTTISFRPDDRPQR
jgi:protein TonB